MPDMLVSTTDKNTAKGELEVQKKKKSPSWKGVYWCLASSQRSSFLNFYEMYASSGQA